MSHILFKLFVILQILALLQSSTVVVADPPQPISIKPVVVQGSVYCKACKHRDTLEGAAPIEGVIVKLSCKNEQNTLKQAAKTNKDGIFLFKKPKQLSLDGFRACKVSLVSSSLNSCNNPTDLNLELNGFTLSQMHQIASKKPVKYDLFAMKPFTYEPSTEGPCEDVVSYKPDEVICNPQCVLINYMCTC